MAELIAAIREEFPIKDTVVKDALREIVREVNSRVLVKDSDGDINIMDGDTIVGIITF